MKIGIIGGTFDPIHNGHRDIALNAKNEYALDELWFMPAGDPYCKSDKEVTPASVRLEMTRLAVSEMPSFCRCCDLEIRTEGPTYTSETLERLHAQYPEDEFFFIVGADSLLYMEDWHRPELIFRYAVVLCADRPGEDDAELYRCMWKLNEKYGCGEERIRIIHCRELPISSTDIRLMMERGGDISPYVARKVLDFIEDEGLYGYSRKKVDISL